MMIATDVETTGLRLEEGHQLLEIQVYILEDKYPFKQIGHGFHRYVKHDPKEVRALANAFVKAMHDETKLWSYIEQGHPLEQVDEDLLDYLQRNVPKNQGRVMGNSIRLDMNFMDAYLPKTMDWLHYRFLDVTGLSWFAYENFGVPYYTKKTGAVHTADHDVTEAVAELRHVTEGLNTARNFDVKVMRRSDNSQTITEEAQFDTLKPGAVLLDNNEMAVWHNAILNRWEAANGATGIPEGQLIVEGAPLTVLFRGKYS